MTATSSSRDASPRSGDRALPSPPSSLAAAAASPDAAVRPTASKKRRHETSSVENGAKSTNRKRYLRFLKAHELKFGLAPVARDVATGEVTIVVCRFCQHFGREQRPDKQRRSTKNVKYFRNSFRTDQYQQHHEISHGETWRQYQASSDEAKRVFFQRPEVAAAVAPEKLPGRAVNASAKLDLELAPGEIWVLEPTNEERRKCFNVTPAIVEVVAVLAIGATEMTVVSALKKQSHRMIYHAHEVTDNEVVQWCPPKDMFQSCELLGTAAEPLYRVIVHSRAQIDCMVELAAAGLSFRQISSAMRSFCVHAPVLLSDLVTKSKDLGSDRGADALRKGARSASLRYSEEQTAEFIRLIIAANLTAVSRLLCSSWAFSLELRASMEHAPMRSYLDFRVKVYGQGAMHSVHLVSIPAFESKCKGMMYNTLDKVLSAVLPSWRHRLIGVTTDGDARMPARVLDIVARLQEEAATPIVYRSCTACHQLDCIVTNFYSSLQGGCFLLALKDLSTYIRRRPELLAIMSPPPALPEVTSSSLSLRERWIALGKETNWIAAHRNLVFHHLEVVKPPSAPDNAWWLFFAAADWVATRTNEAFTKLLFKRAIIADQVAAIAALSRECAAAFYALGPDNDPLLVAEPTSHSKSFKSRKGHFALNKPGVIAFLRETKPPLAPILNTTEAPIVDLAAENLAMCGVNLIESLLELSIALGDTQSSHGSRGPTMTREMAEFLPPTLPHELVQLSGREFASLLHMYSPIIVRFMSTEDMNTMNHELQALRRAAVFESNLRESLATCSANTPFQEAWAATGHRYKALERFAGGFASVFSCTPIPTQGSTSDLALCRIDMDTARVVLADFALEGTLHAQQFPALMALNELLETTRS
uniref:Transposase n=1 Tax=Peronospora matthiolae TaxID=2874970 RepID=A0AAV1VCD7_9STRA